MESEKIDDNNRWLYCSDWILKKKKKPFVCVVSASLGH